MSEDRNLRLPEDESGDESTTHTRRSLVSTAMFGVSVVGLGAILTACGGDDDDDVNDAVNTVESEGGDAVDDVEDGADDAVDEVEDGVDDVEDEVDDAVDEVETEVDS